MVGCRPCTCQAVHAAAPPRHCQVCQWLYKSVPITVNDIEIFTRAAAHHMSIIQDWAAFVCGASAAALPDAERAIQRRHVADTLVAAVAGSRTSEGRALRALLPRAAVSDAIGMQAAVIRHTEIDDIHTRSCTTPSSVTVPAALSLARDRPEFDPDQVASAIWVGTELMTRLGAAVDGARVLYRGLWPTYFAAPLGAAAIAARLWRLDQAQTAHALSLALMLAAGRAGRFQGKLPGRSVILAIAATAGLRATAAARAGVGGDPDLLDGPWLRDAQGLEADPALLTQNLGAGSVYTELSLKPFCSAKQAISSIEALMSLLDDGVAADAITQVRVRVPPPYARMIAMNAEAGSRSSTIVSAAFQMGLAAYWRERLYDIEREDVMRDEAVMAFARKVEITADEALLESFPTSFPAAVEVTASGQVLRKRVTATRGDPTRPLDNVALADKAERVLSRMEGAPAAKPLVELGLAGLQDKAACKMLADTLWNTCAE
jgi:2-methylcitrate dehydratase PrpD